MDFDLHGRPPFVPPPLLELDEWHPCSLELDLHHKGYKVNFKSNGCTISHGSSGKVLFTGKRVNNIYLLDILEIDSVNECFLSKSDESWLCHKRLAHIHTNHLNKLKSKDLVSGLPNIKFQNNKLCDACVKGKQIRTSFKSKDIISTKKPLDVLHMDLFGPSRVASLVGKGIDLGWVLA